MPTASQTLAAFAADLDLAHIPAAVAGRAKDCIIDTVACAAFGAQFPWSRMVADYARRYGSGGVCSIIDTPRARVHAPYAAFANGVFAQAFELDSVTHPSHGLHPGATLLPAVLALCEESGAGGRTALTAFVAGSEVMFRIGAASHHSPERIGFHAPGLIGTYGAAIAAGKVLGLNANQLAHALGIAGSLSSGLLAFGKSRQGAMVKRLHVGRSAESGVLAARLAACGYTGPETVLDGRFGFLDAYCVKAEADPALLTAGLGSVWKTLCICLKRYACEKHAQPAIQALRELMAEHAFTGAQVAGIEIEGGERLVTHHDIREPADIMKAQYSIPFSVALALFRDPDDPGSFDAMALEDPAIRAASHKVELRRLETMAPSALMVRVHVRLADGRRFSRTCETFKGVPDDPLTGDDLRRKFMLLTPRMGEAAARLFEKLQRIETQPVFTLGTDAATA